MQSSWQHNIRTSFRSSQELGQFLEIPIDHCPDYPIFIPYKMAEKIKEQGVQGPLFKQFVPTITEVNATVQSGGYADPIGDKTMSQGDGIIHRYANRLLFTPTTVCPINCRYCFRKNELGSESFFTANLNRLASYLSDHPEVNEVILTGGDPLILNDKKLEQCFEVISNVPTIHFLRIHTRFPVILPERINDELLDLIHKYSKKIKILIAIHTNHISELDDEVCLHLNLLAKSSATLLSQTVLLKGINDSAADLENLFLKLDTLRIRPYYLHHPDRVLGAMHFYLPLEEGRHIYSKLRNKLPGWLIPSYVIDGPEGKGKVPAFNPETFQFSGKLIDKDGLIYSV